MPILLVWLLFGIGAAIVASNKGRSAFGWLLLGVLLGPFGLLFALLVSKVGKPLLALNDEEILNRETKKCPQCAETIKLAAKKCRYCQETFDPDQVDREIDDQQRYFKDMIASGKKFCPACGRWSSEKVMLPSGDMGSWCPTCKKPFS